MFLNIMFHASMGTFQLNQNWNYLHFQVSPSYHSSVGFVAVGLSSFLHLLHVLLGVEVSTERPAWVVDR